MKKVSLVLLGMMALGFFGCDNGGDSGDGNPSASVGLDASRVHPLTATGDTIQLTKVPMFIVFGWDDNGIADTANTGGSSWIRNYLIGKTNNAGTGQATTFDGSQMLHSFYMTGKYGSRWVYEDNNDVKYVWQQLYDDGHEIGLHSMEHAMMAGAPYDNYDAKNYTRAEWKTLEFDPVVEVLTGGQSDNIFLPANMELPLSDLTSWRTPRLEWNNALLGLLKDEGILYDCSIESKQEGGNSGTTEYWPFTLDNGHPDYPEVNSHVGLWELPAYQLHIPTALQTKAGVDIITGLDYNIWIKKDWGGLELSGPDFTEILKYNLDQRMAGNRAPLHVGVHSDIYTDGHEKNTEYIGTANARERQLAIEDFIAYAQATYPEVRIITGKQLVGWLSDPVGLE